MVFSNSKQLLAFTHVEKAAGTTLIHILRYNYFLRYCDVRPLIKSKGYIKPKGEYHFVPESKINFQGKDLKLILKINPFLKFIGGHSVKPNGNLVEEYPNIIFITLLRNPVERYISRYYYLKERMGKKFDLDKFLTLNEETNYQTKKIAGKDDLELAIKILQEKFLLVGLVEEFDEFLILLKNKLNSSTFNPAYSLQNVASEREIRDKLLKENEDKIMINNQTDIALYNFVKDIMLVKEKENYGPSFKKDQNIFKENNYRSIYSIKSIVDFLIRKSYYNPLFGIIRIINGMSYTGEY